MEDTKKANETVKPEELAERVELTDEQLDQASGGGVVLSAVEEIIPEQIAYNAKFAHVGGRIGHKLQ